MAGGYGEWNESLFGCFDDLRSCLCGSFFAPCLFGENAQQIDGSNCCLYCCAYSVLGHCYLCWVPHYMKRTELRQKYGLREDPSCGDIPTTLCCSPCALCQEARFLNRQGRQGFVVGNMAPQMAPQMTQPGRRY